MPSATPELQQKMEARFGNRWADEGPTKFLRDAGYTLTDKWEWRKEGVTSYDAMTQDEYDCLLFLVQEWDYGGLADLTPFGEKVEMK